MSEEGKEGPKLKVIKGGLRERYPWKREPSDEVVKEIVAYKGEGLLEALDSPELKGPAPKRGTKKVPQLEEQAKARSLIERLETSTSKNK